jgi:hypothetical protein
MLSTAALLAVYTTMVGGVMLVMLDPAQALKPLMDTVPEPLRLAMHRSSQPVTAPRIGMGSSCTARRSRLLLEPWRARLRGSASLKKKGVAYLEITLNL